MKYSHTPTSLFFFLLYTDRAIYHCHICTEGLCIWTSFCQVKQKKKKRDGEKEIATTASTRTVGQTLRHTRVSAVKIKTQHRRLQGHGQISPDSICQIQNTFDCQNSGWSCFSIETLVNVAKLGIAKRCSPISLHTRRPISWLPPHQKLKKLRISNITISTNSFPLAL